MSALKHLLRYIAGMREYGCTFNQGGDALELIGYSDSDYSNNYNGRKSTSDTLFFLGGGPMSWQS